MELTGRSGGGGATGHSAAVHSVDFGGCSPAVLVCMTAPLPPRAFSSPPGQVTSPARFANRHEPQLSPRTGSARFGTLTSVTSDVVLSVSSKSLTSPQDERRSQIDLVAIARGKESKIVATWSKTAGLCFYALPTGELLSQVFQMIWSPDSITDKGGKTYQQVLCTVSKDGRTRAWTPTSG
eukprot:762928-Hanusia_phi.AAC.5